MPLVLYGARQIGKTWVLEKFGKNNYKNTVYVNFEREANLLPYFNDNISPKNIIKVLEEYYNEKINQKETLIIFDEIQTCNRALTSLKYFAEDAKEYDVVAAGSLLGVHINSINFSFPVGKVITKTMYLMDFEGFLWVLNKNILLEKIEYCFINNIPLEEGLHYVHFERPTENGFDSVRFELPSYKIVYKEGNYTEEEIDMLKKM